MLILRVMIKNIFSVSPSVMGWACSLRRSDWTTLPSTKWLPCCNLLQRSLPRKLVEHVCSFNFIEFKICVLINELINGDIATTNSDHETLSLLYLDVHSLLTKEVNTFCFPQEHDFKFSPLRVFIQELGQSNVYFISLLAVVNGISGPLIVIQPVDSIL